MRSFLSKDFVRLLKAIDDELDSARQLVIIGGAAIALGYKVPIPTRDIDTMNSTKSLQRAVAQTGLNIPLSMSGVADAPYHYEDWLRPLKRPVLRHLAVLVTNKRSERTLGLQKHRVAWQV